MEAIINWINSMFDISQISLTDQEIIFFFFKAFSVVFALLYFFYALILTRQTVTLKDTLSTANNSIIVFISQVQLLVSVFILLYALFLL